MKTFALALGLILSSLATASAQQLLAWPINNPGLRVFLPGMPIRPLPPMPRPIPRPPIISPIPQPTPLPNPEGTVMTFTGYNVDGTINDQTADLTFDITFHNPGNMRLEGVLLVPIPADTVLSGFTMTVNGKNMNGELLEFDKASTIYQGIVSRMRDPALLELVGERLFRARVFPIEPNGDVSVHLKLTQLLHKSGELVSLSIPVRSAYMVQGAPGRASVNLKLDASAPIRTLYSPLAGVRIDRVGDKQARISYEESGARPAADLDLFFSMKGDPLAASILAHREDGEDGYFMLSLSPRLTTDAGATPKDIVFVLDRSGSMEDNGKMDQARKALSYCIGRLTASDRFAIVDFATDANTFESGLVAASQANKARAKRYVEGISAAGSTNIDGALEETFKFLHRSEGRMPMVFFITDGLPTVGVSDVNELLRRAHERNASLNARLFAFGVGSDVNTLLLDKLSADNRGSRDYVAPGEDIEGKVSSLYQKVAKPVLTDVRIDWQGITAKEVYPRPVTDLFYGSELVLMGRYGGHGKGSLVVTGRMAGKPARFVFPLELPGAADHAFLPKLWAGMKVAHELDAVRLSGHADQETIASIVKLAKKYGIVTPYTSYLITEEGESMPRIQTAAVSAIRGMAMDAASSGFSGGAKIAARAQKASNFFGAFSGGVSTMISGAASSLGGGGVAAAPAAAMAVQEAEVRQEMKSVGSRATETRTIAGKTFYKRGNIWVDGDYELRSGAEPATVRVKYLSQEYFDLLTRKPALARYLALGDSLKVMDGGILYEVTAQ